MGKDNEGSPRRKDPTRHEKDWFDREREDDSDTDKSDKDDSDDSDRDPDLSRTTQYRLFMG